MMHLRTIHLDGHPLRIYASPRSEPDHPWASFDDLMALAQWNEEIREDLWTQMRDQSPEMVHEMRDGTRLIAEPMVGGLFVGWLEMGCKPAQRLLDEWEHAWFEILVTQYVHLPRSEWVKVVEAAGLQNVPTVPGMTTH